MGLNIVSNEHVIGQLSRSRYFRKNLGLVQTVERGATRVYNDKDKFNFFYSNRYNAMIYAKGNVGDIKFYSDHYIRENVLAIYYGENFEEFIFEFDENFVRDKGVDAYLGSILKECDERYDELKKNNELKKIEEKPKGDPNKVFSSPGQVTWDDLKVYLDEKRKKNQL